MVHLNAPALEVLAGIPRREDNPLVVGSAGTGNHDSLVTAAGDERRFCILDVSPARRNDHEYFERLIYWLENGGASALLHYLQHHEIRVNLRIVPKTRALLDHKLASLDTVQQWYLGCLQDGSPVPGEPWEGLHTAEAVRDSYIAQAGGSYGRSTATSFGLRLLRFKSVRKDRAPGNGPHGYIFAPLKECRAEFQELIGFKLDWPEELPPDPTRASARRGIPLRCA
ncbi:MAG: hypothetical protein U1E53_17505 [Dongiaceae bacterium]